MAPHPLADSLPRPLGLVLGGGASLGALQVGHLLALREAGIVPDLVVGTSVGALNGAFVAADPDGAAQRLREVWHSVRRRDIFPLHPVAATGALLGHQASLLDGSGLAGFVARHQPAESFEQLRLPLLAVATDELAGAVRVIGRGPLHPAVMASAAIPGVFPPVVIDGVRLVDGGLLANVPITAAFGAGARSVLVSDAGAPGRLLEPPAGVLEAVVHAVELLMRAQVEREVERNRGRGPIIYLPTPAIEQVSPIDFAGTPALIERARAEAAIFLAEAPGRIPGAGVHGGPLP